MMISAQKLLSNKLGFLTANVMKIAIPPFVHTSLEETGLEEKAIDFILKFPARKVFLDGVAICKELERPSLRVTSNVMIPGTKERPQMSGKAHASNAKKKKKVLARVRSLQPPGTWDSDSRHTLHFPE